MERYDPQAVEEKWQRVWRDERAFEVPNPSAEELTEHRQNTYVLEMLPYPSGDLHMGHVRNYMLGEVVAHFRRRHGYAVMRPMGFDAFGLPAENAAIQEGVHPRESTERNVAAIRSQMERMGWAIDWSRVLSTHEPEYYRWTQWLFLRFFEKGLAYRKEGPVKWCPNDQTVLANEQVVDGRCERCGAEVEARNLVQWYFRITDYADQLLDEMAPREDEPERAVVERETIELTFVAVIQALPPRQRAVLIMRDVLDWTARATAELLDMTVAAANSALQRARATIHELLPQDRTKRSAAGLSEHEQRLLKCFIDAHERGDAAAAIAMVREDIRITMPPHPFLYEGRAAMGTLLERAFGPEQPGDWLLVPTLANRMPAAASYLRAYGDDEFRAFKLDVLRVEDDLVAEVTTFGHALFPEFGLPATWES